MYSPDAQCSKKSPHVQRIWKLLCIDYCKRLKRWLIDWTILLSWNKQFFPHQGQWIKNLINTYFFHKISQKKLVLDHKSSVVDPNTLNLDPDPGFRPNLDPDPEISWIRIQIRIRNTGWIWNGGLSKFSSKTDPELKNSFVTVDTFNIVTFPILFQLLLKLSILKINKGVMKQFITKCYYLFMMKSGLWLKLWVTLIFMTIFKSWKVEQSFMFFTTKENSS